MSEQLSKEELIEISSVSHGTMRNEDLIPTFLSMLESLDSIAYNKVITNYPEYNNEEPSEEFYESEEALYMLEDLFDAFNDLCPEGMYFGAHPGDGADYGFWEDVDPF